MMPYPVRYELEDGVGVISIDEEATSEQTRIVSRLCKSNGFKPLKHEYKVWVKNNSMVYP